MDHALVAITDGLLIPLSQVKDPVFSQKMLGDGIAIIPKSECIVAPCKGRITMLYPTLHAFGLRNEEGLEILIHIGIDTVELKGQGFHKHVHEGDDVEAGDKIISIHPHYLTNDAYDFTSMMLFPGCEKELHMKTSGYVRKGKDIVVTYGKERKIT